MTVLGKVCMETKIMCCKLLNPNSSEYGKSRALTEHDSPLQYPHFSCQSAWHEIHTSNQLPLWSLFNMQILFRHWKKGVWNWDRNSYFFFLHGSKGCVRVESLQSSSQIISVEA